MTVEQVLLILITVFIPIGTHYIKKRLEHSLRTEFDRQIESIRQTFQRELASIKADYEYKQVAIKSSFEQTVKLNDTLWPAYWAHQDLWSFENMSVPDREVALSAIVTLREFLFSHQIFFDAEIYENSIRAMVSMLALSRFRAAGRQPPEVRTGRDMQMETEINTRLDNIVRLIREKFELGTIPADLRIPTRPTPIV
jgi:hypothetical protein